MQTPSSFLPSCSSMAAPFLREAGQEAAQDLSLSLPSPKQQRSQGEAPHVHQEISAPPANPKLFSSQSKTKFNPHFLSQHNTKQKPQ